MKYTEEMMLQSPSGYCMPFEEQQGREVEVIQGYGEHTDKLSGKKVFNHGIDFSASHYVLAALASGSVSGISSDAEHGIYQVIRYGKYEVTYANLSNIFVNFGQSVRAGQTVAVCGDSLHMEVKFDGTELNPIEFLTMLYGNLKATRNRGRLIEDELQTFDMTMRTNYDESKEEIEQLMLRFLPFYMEDLQRGIYTVPEHTEQSLRNVFSVGATKNYFFENIPSLGNPLGLGQRAVPLACKVQNLLIADF